MNYYNNKIAWVTGASSGIGEALVYALNDLNCITIISARREEELNRVKKGCSNPQLVHLQVLDLEQNDKFQEVTTSIIKEFGKIDFLFNNGGVSQRGTAAGTGLEVDRKIMEVNFFGNIALTKAVLPFMINEKAGHIMVTTSVAGKYGFFQRSTYSASKHALHGFYDSLRLEQLENNIKITLVVAGPVNTSMATNALIDNGEKQGKSDRLLEAGMSASSVAQKIIKGMIRQKEDLYIGKKELIPIYIKRFFPFLFTPIMAKQNPNKTK